MQVNNQEAFKNSSKAKLVNEQINNVPEILKKANKYKDIEPNYYQVNKSSLICLIKNCK